MRLKLLQALSLVPDFIMLRLQYFVKTGRFLNLKNPTRYTEKIQWYKLKYRDPRITVCSDKFAVRQYVRERGFPEILNDLYGVWDHPDDFDLADCPDSFILKSTHGSGTNFIVNDKKRVNEEDVRSIVKAWFNYDAVSIGREWGYKGIQPRLIAEKVFPRDARGDLPDYKFSASMGRFIVFI